MNIKDEVWNELKENVKVFKELKNIFFLGCFGMGKFLFINIMIMVLIGKYDLYVDVGVGIKYSIIRLYRFV